MGNNMPRKVCKRPRNQVKRWLLYVLGLPITASWDEIKSALQRAGIGERKP